MEIDQLFSDHLQTAVENASDTQNELHIISQVADYNVETPKNQFRCLSSISNYHLMAYPDGAGRVINPKGHIGYQQHILHTLESHNIPTSPRNRLMYYINMEASNAPALLVKRYLAVDNKELESEITAEHVEPKEPVIRKKRRKHQQRIVSVTLKDLSKSCGEDLDAILNSAQQKRKLYERFKEQLVLEGSIKWRHHDATKDICILTNYKM